MQQYDVVQRLKSVAASPMPYWLLYNGEQQP